MGRLLLILITGLTASGAIAQTTASAPTTTTAPAGARWTSEGWFAPLPRTQPLPPLPEKIDKAFVIPIHGAISGTTADVVERKILRCKTGGAQIVIFDMDTPGGAGDAMIKIEQLILDELKDVRTVAYVHPEAISAGSVISLACNEIVMASSARLGDAMPIMMGQGGELVEMPEKERGKMESYIRSLMRNLAERNGYDPLLCQAMITITIEVWEIRNSRTGELRYVDASQWRGRVSGAPAGTQPSAPPQSGDEQWQFVKLIDGPMELLTMTTSEAINLGFAKYELPTMEDVKKHYNIVSAPTVLEDNWSEGLVNFLTSPAVTAILMFIAILGIYIEFSAPGHILPGVVGVICLAIVFGSRYLVGMAQWWEIALFGLGVVLVLVELLLIPGHGVSGVIGVILCLVGLAAMLIPSAPDTIPIPSTPLEWRVFTDGALAVAIALVAAAVAGWILASYLPKVPVANRLVLPPVAPAGGPPVVGASPLLAVRPGDVGVVEAVCRPTGKVRFGQTLLDAASQGDIIDPGEKVRVLRRDGNQLVVEKIS